jgi:proline iminopeptidase
MDAPRRDPLTWRYPPLEPYRTGMLPVGEGHELYFEESGLPSGKPVLFLHGGPGAGSDPAQRRFFDPRRYRIILLDQRGSGKSTPRASLIANTTWDLVEDLEKLRRHLAIDRWQVFGGSWGSTLALAYAETHLERVTELVLRGIFLGRQAEIDWLYRGGAGELFPEAFAAFMAAIPPGERSDPVKAYHARVTAGEEAAQAAAAVAWSAWEGSVSKLLPDEAFLAHYEDPRFAIPFARIECHFFVNRCFLKADDQLLSGAARLRGIPAVLVHGRYDACCTIKNAWDLHRAWPEADFVVVPDAGHSASEPGISRALVAATDQFAGR